MRKREILTPALLSESVQCSEAAVFSAYVDESYDSLIFAMGAWVGPCKSFTTLETQWRRVIRHHGLTRYHASEANAVDHDFKGWPKPKLDVLSKTLIRIITHRRPNSSVPRHVYGVHTAVIMEDYDQFMSAQAKESYSDPYALCAQWMFEEIADRSASLYPDERVNFIFDENKPHTKRLSEIYLHLKQSPKTKNPQRLGAWSMASSFDLCSLQAADILAYETFKEMKRQVTDPARKVRPALNNMFNNVDINGRCFDKEACENISVRLREKALERGAHETGQNAHP